MVFEVPMNLQSQLDEQRRRILMLEAESARQRRLIGNVPGMVYQFLLRPDGWMGFVFVSEGSREVYGRESEEIVQDYRAAFDQVHAEDAASFMRSVRASAAALSPYKWEGRLQRDGKTRWIQAASRPHRQDDGILWDGIILDITQRKEADAALAHSFRQEETIRLQAELLQQLSVPLIPLTAGIVVMPLVGRVDELRAARILETLLHGLAHARASIVILDITGVPGIDAATASMLVQVSRAATLLGAELILTGIRPDVARSLVDQDVDLSSVRILGSLAAAIAAVLGPHRVPAAPR